MPLLDLLRRWAGGALREREMSFEHRRSLLLTAGPDGFLLQPLDVPALAYQAAGCSSRRRAA